MSEFVNAENLNPFFQQVARLDLEILKFCLDTRTWHTGGRILRQDYALLEQIYRARQNGIFLPNQSPNREEEISNLSMVSSSNSRNSIIATLGSDASDSDSVSNFVYIPETSSENDESQICESDSSEQFSPSYSPLSPIISAATSESEDEEFNPTSHSSPVRIQPQNFWGPNGSHPSPLLAIADFFQHRLVLNVQVFKI